MNQSLKYCRIVPVLAALCVFGILSAGPVLAQAAGESDDGDANETLDGPYFLRSADPLEAGELELKFVYGYEKAESDEEQEFEFVLEWGLAEGHEFILEIPVELGEGKVKGNGDIAEFGFHSRIWDEDGSMPAFSMRNLIRIPTGYESDGVDYIGRGLFTSTLVPGSLRLHFNPFLKSINGNQGEDTRNFQWGAALGFDYRVNDDLLFIMDYQNFSSDEEGVGRQQSLEIGGDWEFTEDQKIGFQAEFELDGDGHGADFGAKISYIVELDAPRVD